MNYLCFHVCVSECEEEPFAVVGPQPVDAAGVDGAAEVVVHFLLRVPLLLVSARPDSQSETRKQCILIIG